MEGRRGMDFTGKAVLVTGASQGIGRAIARQFAARGARVAVHCHRNRSAAERTRAGLPGGPHLIVEADIGDADAVERMVGAVAAELGRLDVLVNNAGIHEPHPIAEVSYDVWQACWRRTLETNLLGAANAAWCAARHMMGQRAGASSTSRRAARSGASPRRPPTGRARRG